MAFGGGTFVTQNKKLPGAYINVVSTDRATATVSDRGIAAIMLPLTAANAGKVIEITAMEYLQDPDSKLGADLPQTTIDALDELFCKATSAFIYNNYNGEGAKAVAEITLDGTTPTGGTVNITGGTTTVSALGDINIGSNTIESLFALTLNDAPTEWTVGTAIPASAHIVLTAVNAGALAAGDKTALEGSGFAVTDGTSTIEAPTMTQQLKALEPYDFNCIACYTDEEDDVDDFCSQIELWRDTVGKKCVGVVYNQDDPDYEGIINVINTVSDEGAPEYALVAWVTGAQAGCNVNASVQNTKYDGKWDVVCEQSQTELEDCIEAGQFVFHLSYGDVVVLDDINSLVTTTVDKGEDFKSNQTIRVVDQIANDIAKLFCTKYLGKIPNDAAGRVSLWADIVKHHQQLNDIRAITEFESEDVVVSQGDSRKDVYVEDSITPVNAMSRLYLVIRVL